MLKRGVHQAFDFGEGSERGTVAMFVAMSTERADGNHGSSWLGEGVSRGRGTSQFLSFFVRPGQSASCHQV